MRSSQERRRSATGRAPQVFSLIYRPSLPQGLRRRSLRTGFARMKWNSLSRGATRWWSAPARFPTSPLALLRKSVLTSTSPRIPGCIRHRTALKRPSGVCVRARFPPAKKTVALRRGGRHEVCRFDDCAIRRRSMAPLERALKRAATQLIDDVRQPFLRKRIVRRRSGGRRGEFVFLLASLAPVFSERRIIGDVLQEKIAALRRVVVTSL